MKNYPGPIRTHLQSYPPRERWDDWTELDSRAWPKRVEHHYMLVPTTCFNCESACGLLAYVDLETLEIRKFEGNPEHPGSRGRNCAKGPATLNQLQDPNRILHPLRVRIEIVAGLEVRADEQNDVGVRMIGTRTIEAHPELIAAARARRADVRVRVVAVDAPRR